MRLLLVVGKSPEWADDVAAFEAMGVPHDKMGINAAAIWLKGKATHAFSYCPTEVNRVKEFYPDTITHAALPGEADHYWRMKGDTGGSSSLMGTKVALKYLGYDRVVLAGVPLTGYYHRHFFQHWREAVPFLAGRVRSMSGHTRDLLGYPDKEWLHEHIC